MANDPSKIVTFWFDGIRLCLIAMLAAAAVFLDPFGITSALDRASERAIYRVASPFIASPNQDRIVVILIDDEALQSWDQAWPPKRSRVGELAHTALESGAESVFIDMYFDISQQQMETAAFTRRLTRTSRQDALVATADLGWFLPPVDPAGVQPGAFDTKARYRLHPNVPTFTARRTEHDYTLCFAPPAPGIETGPEVHNAGCGRVDRASPALALFNFHCALKRSAGASAPEGRFSSRCEAWSANPEASRSLSMLWPYYNPAPAGTDCPHPSLDGERPLLRSVRLAASGFSVTDGLAGLDRSNAACPPFATYSAHRFDVKDDQSGQDAIASPESLRDIFEGRTIFIGSAAGAAQDLALTPAHGAMPAVFVHAAAYFNLLEFGPDYLGSPTGTPWDSYLELALIVAIAFAAFLAQYQDRDRPSEIVPVKVPSDERHKHGDIRTRLGALSKLGVVAVLIFGPAFIALCLLALFNWPPFNWLSIALIGATFALDFVNEDLDAWLEERCRTAAEHSLSNRAGLHFWIMPLLVVIEIVRDLSKRLTWLVWRPLFWLDEHRPLFARRSKGS